jgi:hypothetical protein
VKLKKLAVTGLAAIALFGGLGATRHVHRHVYRHVHVDVPNAQIDVPLMIVFSSANPTVACTAVPGTLVATVGYAGGDGNPVSWSLTSNMGDFALIGQSIVVGPNGIAVPNCGRSVSVTVTGTQD